MERVLGVKLLPPVLPGVLVDRPRLDTLLREVMSKRLCAVIAPAGFGKSTLLATWAITHRSAWYSITPEDTDADRLFRGVVAALQIRIPDLRNAVSGAADPGLMRGPEAGTEQERRAVAQATVLALALEDLLVSDLALVLDDVHELAIGSPSARFVAALCRQAPPMLHLVALSRTDLPFSVARLRARAQAAELTGSAMAFGPEETAEVVRRLVDVDDVATARRLHEATGGWPAAVRIASESLRDRNTLGTTTFDVVNPDTYEFLSDEVLGVLEPDVARLVQTVAPLESFTPGLCEALGVEKPARTLESMARRGLLLVPHSGGGGWYSLHPLLRSVARERLQRDPEASGRVLLAAADWFAAAGHRLHALRHRVAAGDADAVLATLEEHGSNIIAEGGAADILDAAAIIPLEERPPALHRIEGEARQALGDWSGAMLSFDRLRGPDGSLPPGAAWRVGLIHYQRGELDAAAEAYERGLRSPGPDGDRGMVLAWSAAIHWLRGDVDRCRAAANEALELGTSAGDDRTLAAAHTAFAMVAALEGDRRSNEAHYVYALDHATKCNDALQLIRIRANRASHYHEEGESAEALVELDAAMRLADVAGYGTLRALALSNRGQALKAIGRLDEAARDLEAARQQFGQVGATAFRAYPLVNLGEVHRLRGDHDLARLAFDEALSIGEASNDLQAVTPALCGLALLWADTDPDRARTFADRAAAVRTSMGLPRTTLVQGIVALAAGDRSTAATRAGEAATLGREQLDRATVAGARHLAGASTDEPDIQARHFADARTLWESLGNPIGVAEVELAMAATASRDDAIELAATALERLRIAGARSLAADAAALIAELRSSPTRDLAVRVLGVFQVTRHGELSSISEWGSRKSRDLFKLLVARRSGPVRRDEIVEVLWPDDDPRRAARKLSVALSTLRADLDPQKRFPADHFIVAERAAMRLQRHVCDIDLDTFLAFADDGLRSADQHAVASADRLVAAEAMYRGDPFVEDLYEEWSRSIRELSRATYASVIRVLADSAAGSGEHDQAVRLLLRIIDGDPYDEGAHLALVSSLQAERRHGEAHRMYRVYSERMEEIDVEPAPLPDLNRA